jgi:hypothetical protein
MAFLACLVLVHYAAEYVYDYGDGTKNCVGLWRKFTVEEPVKAPRG